MKQCSIEDCEAEHYARGWCNRHYLRWRKHGDPLGRARLDPDSAFEARSEPLIWSDCIIWTGAPTAGGYGTLCVNGMLMLAHRYAWQREHGPIPDGMVIDHTCWERSCVNVEHLRLATPAQNVQSRSGAMPGRKHDLPRGVSRHGRGYRATVGHNGQRHYLGIFDTPEEASKAAQTKRVALFGIFAGRA